MKHKKKILLVVLMPLLLASCNKLSPQVKKFSPYGNTVTYDDYRTLFDERLNELNDSLYKDEIRSDFSKNVLITDYYFTKHTDAYQNKTTYVEYVRTFLLDAINNRGTDVEETKCYISGDIPKTGHNSTRLSVYTSERYIEYDGENYLSVDINKLYCYSIKDNKYLLSILNDYMRKISPYYRTSNSIFYNNKNIFTRSINNVTTQFIFSKNKVEIIAKTDGDTERWDSLTIEATKHTVKKFNYSGYRAA